MITGHDKQEVANYLDVITVGLPAILKSRKWVLFKCLNCSPYTVTRGMNHSVGRRCGWLVSVPRSSSVLELKVGACLVNY